MEIKKIIALLLIVCTLFMFAACGKTEPVPEPAPVPDDGDTAPGPSEEDAVIEVSGLETIHETEFGGVYLKMTIDEFNSKGFMYGDSVDITFSNGYKLEDIPYYNGYYVDAGEALLIAYPGYDYIKAAINYGDDLWERAGLKALLLGEKEGRLWSLASLDEHSTATVTLRESGKYLDNQEARDIHYSDDRTKFPSDVVFANFRNMTVGNLRPDTVYRSASPCDNQHNRATYVNDLIREAGVGAILNLSDNEEKIEKYISQEDFNCPYFLELYKAGNVVPISLNMNYLSEEFAQKIASGFIELSEKDGPYLVHCTEGKDRTGFVCMIIEALAGASYHEIVDDYMVTYDNYYEINEEKDPGKYKTIKEKNIDAMLSFLVYDGEDITAADLSEYARGYLKEAGMTDEQLDKFVSKITN
ncbi:MAG: tyrosine-protein phosphatase [Oscillospiraceae bacterium]|nr:tyrosine-protein phosphatase [Oscillospiraceae bacterium]